MTDAARPPHAPDGVPATDWPAAWARLRTLEGDEWDAESERLDQLWKDEYSAEFIRFALSRGWIEEDAQSWLPETAEEALLNCSGADSDPISCARVDVPECEREAANAC